jgi:hypothetical protein
MYIIIFKFKTAIITAEFFLICKILMCFAKKIIIRYFNIILKNHAWLITWLMKKINKKKSQKIIKKMLIIKKLFNKNIVIIINIKKIKK